MKTKYHILYQVFACAKSKLVDKSYYLTFCTFKNQNYNPWCLISLSAHTQKQWIHYCNVRQKKPLQNKTESNLYLWHNIFPHNCCNDSQNVAKIPVMHWCPHLPIFCHFYSLLHTNSWRFPVLHKSSCTFPY